MTNKQEEAHKYKGYWRPRVVGNVISLLLKAWDRKPKMEGKETLGIKGHYFGEQFYHAEWAMVREVCARAI